MEDTDIDKDVADIIEEFTQPYVLRDLEEWEEISPGGYRKKQLPPAEMG